MKTIEELYKEINVSEELKKAVSEISDNDVEAVAGGFLWW